MVPKIEHHPKVKKLQKKHSYKEQGVSTNRGKNKQKPPV